MKSDFAILYRTNAQSRSFEEALRKLNIAYKIYGGISFYQRKEIKVTKYEDSSGGKSANFKSKQEYNGDYKLKL